MDETNGTMGFVMVDGVQITMPCDKLLEALSKMQGQLDNAKKSSDNPFFKSKYADLANCLQTAKKPMAENGLSVSQHCTFNGAEVMCVTVLGHSSGQMMVSTLKVPVVKKDPQGVGSSITYARRYALSSIIGLSQEDDDGNSGAGNVDNKEEQNTDPTEHSGTYATEKQVGLIKTIIGKFKISADSILNRYKVANLESLSKEQASDCIRVLKKQTGEQ